MKTRVGQIFLTHPKDQNYATLYEETFSKFGQEIELFCVLEIASPAQELSKSERQEYQTLAQTLVASFKKTYITASQIDQETFEKALAAANTALSRLAGRGKTSWHKKLHVVLAALRGHELSISAAGLGRVILARQNELATLTQDSDEGKSRPVKIFSYYSTGRVAEGDVLVLSTNQMFNYLSLPRLQEFLDEDLEEAAKEIITLLADVKTLGFAAFLVEIGAARKTQKIFTPSLQSPKQQAAWVAALKLGGNLLLSVLEFLWDLGGRLAKFVFSFFRRAGRKQTRTRKYIIAAAILILLLLVVNVAWSLTKNNLAEKREKQQDVLAEIEDKLAGAEAALIYNDEKQVMLLLGQSQDLLGEVPEDHEKHKALAERIDAIRNKISKKVFLDKATVLATFPNIPTDLLRAPTGMIGFNRSSGSLSFYNFVSGETRPLLRNVSTGHLVMGGWTGGDHGFVFLNKEGNFEKLDLAGDTLVPFERQTQFDIKNSDIADLEILGSGDSARVYLLDSRVSQIWRFRVEKEGPAPGERWLKSAANFADSRDMAIDNSIYIAGSGGLEKYFNGAKQDFNLAPLDPSLGNQIRVFTLPDYQFLYLVDPANERILVLAKDGKLARQLIHAKFRELADVWVDEKNQIIYALSGSELLSLTLP